MVLHKHRLNNHRVDCFKNPYQKQNCGGFSPLEKTVSKLEFLKFTEH